MPRTKAMFDAAARRRYERAAREYCAALPLEHFMESTGQSTQRAITMASFALVKPDRPDFHYFSELLVQYPKGPDPTRKPFGQVVPDNMVVVHPDSVTADGSYDVTFQPAGLFWVLEYVSRGNRRKDYEDNLTKYEEDLKVPYYTVFDPDQQGVLLFRRKRTKYHVVPPAASGRYAVPELDIELAIHDRWLRFWYKGELLPLPADLARELKTAQLRLRAAEDRAAAAEQEIARLRAEVERLKRDSA